ncbi:MULTISPECIES: ABC transporter ATPase [Methylobacterium]|uniref:ABC transporter ATPase n=4 Tax=Pseudomonadota TaxID=1224 RepID=A0ABQ4SVV5_9HYPH|nr:MULTISPECIES: ABC transporter ATPase [Methylobacterium]PIU07731.1 MAG: ABC transporter ATPase [Methylobacterium sp. CG09_land_8_20_14_0_10_71_15]PIU13178.1 MAG: ABC transporter ATPase [Methylobacterium sp. CG08_land_8_20_14_0_20_71_15]GJE07331.1 hypothetical protein AOPFMNJM_2659 [Methylobacterium jeotgali]
MRLLVPALLLFTALPACADECGALADRIAAATGATVTSGRSDFANLEAGPDTGLTLACGPLTSTGVQFKGKEPPERFYALLGKAGAVVTGADPAAIEAAGRQARDAASRLRHSSVDLPGLRIVCSVTDSAERGALTLCAAIQRDDRT